MSLALVFAALIAVLVAANAGGGDDEPEVAAEDGGAQVVRPDSQRLSTGAFDVTGVEFLDFECEACRAAHPAVEELRSRFGDDITSVVQNSDHAHVNVLGVASNPRGSSPSAVNFPLLANSVAAARIAEAAAAHGKFEEMYELLFETQPEAAPAPRFQEIHRNQAGRR